MACAVLIGIFIDETICATGSDCSSKDALSFRAGPVTGLFALFEGFDCTGCQGCASCLGNALLALIASAAAVVAAAT